MFFWLFRRLRGSTLFPYTTLFRSIPRTSRSEPRPRRLCREDDEGDERGRHARGGKRADEELGPDERGRNGHVEGDARGEDRKSTRLNSSHSQISYAVFCLKNKIKI